MPRKRLAFMSAIAASAGALLLSGGASAATQTPAAGNPAAAKTLTAPGTPAAKTPRADFAPSAAKTAAAGSTPAATTTRAPIPAGGKAHIIVYSINSDGPDFQAIVSGAVGDYGPAVTVYPDGKIDPQHTSNIELILTRGTFRLSIASIDKKFVKATSHEPIYPRTCSDFISVTAGVPVVPGSGTGAYRGISGSFTMTGTLNEVEARPCHPAAAFLWQIITLAGPGTVSF
jgi:hypothetical protein